MKNVYVRLFVSMYQNELSSLGVLTVDIEFTKNINSDDVSIEFVLKKTIINTIAKYVLS